MTKWQTRLLACLVALASAACGEATPGEGADEGLGAEAAELKNGTVFGSASVLKGAVRLHIWLPAFQGWTRCTGQVVSQRSILTAAHCVSVLGANAGQTYITAWRQVSATEWRLVMRESWATFVYHPSYNGIDAKHDVALITAPNPLEHITRSDSHSLAKSTPSGETMYAMGYGYYGPDEEDYDGQGRYGKVTPTYDSAALDYIFMNTNISSPELCSGDSGGPLKSAFSGPLLVYGVASKGSGPGWGHCRAYSHWATVHHNFTWLKPRIVGSCFETSTLYSCW
jgi:secreted trypsin-like serine protease